MLPEESLLPFSPREIQANRRLLVLAPHPDDEIFGCGGMLALHTQVGGVVQILIMTHGEQGGNPQQRCQESEEAARRLGLPAPEFAAWPDRGLTYGEPLVAYLKEAIEAHQPDIVLAPSLWENHPDHQALALSALEAVRRTGMAGELWFYEVSSPQRPNVLIDITAVAAAKHAAMQSFSTQLQAQDYLRQIEGLNAYRAYTLGNGVLAAEAFEVIDASRIERELLSLYASAHTRQLQRCGAAPDVGAPLVSILIRSSNRPQIADALRSIALQTWPAVEVIVVNASGQAHAPLTEYCARFPVRLIESDVPLGRADAANQALDAAQGEYACFLDDDDWIAPGHLAPLVSELRTHPALVAAYSSTRVVNAAGEDVDRYAQPYNRALLHLRNYLPIHSVVFRAHAGRNLRFDTKLQVYEDWDFWLQLSAAGAFRHLDQDTAFYRASLGSSQISLSDRDDLLESTQRKQLFDKWQHWWNEVHLDALHRYLLAQQAQQAEAVRSQIEQQLQDFRAAFEADKAGIQSRNEELEQRIVTQDQEASQRDDYVDELHKHINGLEQALRNANERETAISAMHAAALDEQAVMLGRTLQERAALEIELSRSRAFIQELQGSTSWRLTAPLRMLRQVSGRRWRQSKTQGSAEAVPSVQSVTNAVLRAQPWQAPDFADDLGKHVQVSSAQPEAVCLPELIAVVVPVFNGYDYLPDLLRSLATADAIYPGHCKYFFVNDASTDARVRPLLLQGIAQLKDAVLLDNDENLGFVRTANRGLRTALDELPQEGCAPVVILNSDTEVPDGWLERLLKPMLAHPDSVASVTPFTNAGTICSLPRWLEDNLMPEDVSLVEMDRAASHLQDCPMEIPTGVGFCMAMNGRLLRQIGLFDAERYGRGYAEENDWCRRVAALGYVNLLQPGLFVWHKHGGSFASAEKQQLIARNLALLVDRYPDYEALVAAHIEADPSASRRASVALAWLAARGNVALLIDHAMGGGANDYRAQIVRQMATEHSGALVYSEGFHKPSELHIHVWNTVFALPAGDRGLLLDLMPPKAVSTVFYNDAVTFNVPDQLPAELLSLVDRHGAQLVVAIHDFYPVCPSYTLLNHRDQYCGVPEDLNVCRNCLPRNRMMLSSTCPVIDIDRWRGAWGDLLARASEIRCFSDDSAALVRRAYPQSEVEQAITVRPHVVESLPARLPRVDWRAPLVLGVVGAIGLQKGSRIIQRMARLIEARKMPVRIVIIGYADISDFPACVSVTGRYHPEELPELIEAHGVNMALMTSIWPETFSYVTSELMAMNLPIAAFDLGAPAERLRGYPHARLVSAVTAEAMLDAAWAWHQSLAADAVNRESDANEKD